MASDTQPPHVDFIGIGMSKCGTTWLWQCLHEHPEICCGEPKEIHFFDKHYAEGFAWYAACFAACPEGAIVRGEYTPNYLDNRAAMERLLAAYPDAQLIVAVRDPLERLRSVWRFHYGRGLHEERSFEGFLNEHCSREQWERGRYGEHLEWLLTQVSREQVHVIFYADILEHPAWVVRQLYAFLGVDPSVQPPVLNRRRNASKARRPRVRGINPLLHRIERAARNVPGVCSVLRLLGAGHLARSMRRQNTTTAATDELDSMLSTRIHEQVREYYLDDVRRLAELTEQPLEDYWLLPA